MRRGKHYREARQSALERFSEDHPNLEIKSVRTYYDGNGGYETVITIKQQKISYGDHWDEEVI
jgi:hypothetical protein